MYLRTLKLNNFRSCASTTVRFDSVLTVLGGENNAGKTTVIDALRLLSAPTDTRRTRTFEADDLRLGACDLRLSAEFAELDHAQRGLFFTALATNDGAEAFYQVSWAPPQGRLRRRWAAWTVGTSGRSEVEPEVRDLIRHVHLPALRDADRDLASSSPGRIEFLLRQLLTGRDAERDELLEKAKTASKALLEEPPLKSARDRVNDAFRPLSEGFWEHEAHLRFADATLVGLARDLRFSLSEAGLDPDRVLQPGLGYSNLLYLASVLVELEAARDAELTILLVEEPEAHLHPQLQQATLAFLEKRARESAERTSHPGEHAGRVQVVVSTHSPNLTAGTSVHRMVVLRAKPTAPQVVPSCNAAIPNSLQTEAAVEGLGVPPTSDFHRNPVRDERRSDSPLLVSSTGTETVAIAIADLKLASEHARKIDRYLDVTKSTLIFGRRVLLVEGMAEALLLPAFAKMVLRGSDFARFRSASVVAIDGVDFEPYVRLLLTSPVETAASIADRVVVVTDEDPSKPGEKSQHVEAARAIERHEAVGAEGDQEDPGKSYLQKASKLAAGQARKLALTQLAKTLGASERLYVEVTPFTLEASLFGDASTAAQSMEVASGFVKKAFAACEGGRRREQAWAEKIEGFATEERGRKFVEWMNSTGTRKGDFAQALAEVIEQRRGGGVSLHFPVPSHIVRALQFLVG